MDEKPPLAPVLDYYDVQYRPGKLRQKVRCPVHDEQEPSCSIDLADDWFNCHACHAGGDAYSLIMLKEGIDFATAKQRAEAITGGSGYGVSGSNEPGRVGIFGTSGTQPRRGSGVPFRPRIFTADGP